MGTNGNVPARPFVYSLPEGSEAYSGLSKREEFAKAAMQANRIAEPESASERVARNAVKDADALIDALNAEKNAQGVDS